MFCERACSRLRHRREQRRSVFPPPRSKISFPAFTRERSIKTASVLQQCKLALFGNYRSRVAGRRWHGEKRLLE
jgi:hypothetical protein